MKILVVDDTSVSRNMLIKRTPEAIKETAVFFKGVNGQEAVDLYKEHNPDIVFLDLTMPVMDGFEALDLIIKHDSSALVYIITADIQTKAQERVLASGAAAVVAKPVSAAKLAEIYASHAF